MEVEQDVEGYTSISPLVVVGSGEGRGRGGERGREGSRV